MDDPLSYAAAGPDFFHPDELLGKLDRRMERKNRRLFLNLMAWAEILDALGWHVALRISGRAPFYSARIEAWATARSIGALSWEAITEHLDAAPPDSHRLSTPQLHVWADPQAVTSVVPFQALTKREAEVLDWLREGKTGPEVALILGCAQRTVESHVAKIYRKLGLRSRAELHFVPALASSPCPQ